MRPARISFVSAIHLDQIIGVETDDETIAVLTVEAYQVITQLFFNSFPYVTRGLRDSHLSIIQNFWYFKFSRVSEISEKTNPEF